MKSRTSDIKNLIQVSASRIYWLFHFCLTDVMYVLFVVEIKVRGHTKIFYNFFETILQS